MTDIKFKKSEGQHILKNHGLIDTIIEKARIKSTDTVLEVGAGTGSITMKLLQKTRKVVAYENDDKLARELQSKVNRQPELKSKLELIKGDVLYHEFPHFDVCVSNIPFNLSLPIVLKLVAHDFKCAYILVQKEFGARLTARAGTSEYSRLSVIVQLFAHVEHVMKVSKNSFFPAPKVDTCFMRIEPRVPRPPINVAEFDSMLKICFGRKNKTLAANLKTPLLQRIIEQLPDYQNENYADVIDQILERIKMIEMRTAKMDTEDFLTLLLEFKRSGIHFD